MMKTRLPSFLILMILFCLSSNLMAQENREAKHACFKLENERVIPLNLELSQGDSATCSSQHIRMDWEIRSW